MKIKNIIAAAMLAVTICTAPVAALAGNAKTVTVKSAAVQSTKAVQTKENKVVEATNKIRKANGRVPLKESAELNKAAKVRATEMANAQELSHVRPNGTEYSTVLKGPLTGENITRFANHKEEPEVTAVRAWKESEKHFKNMLGPKYTQMGYACVQAKDGAWFAVQILAGPGKVTYIDSPRA